MSARCDISAVMLALGAGLLAMVAPAAGADPSGTGDQRRPAPPTAAALMAPSANGDPIRRAGPRTADDVAVLRDSTAEPAARSAAARRLLAATDAESQRGVAELLARTGENGEVRPIILREIRAMASASPWLLPPLVGLVEGASPQELVLLLEAAGSIRTRDSIRFLLSHAGSAAAAPVRDAAYAALGRLTGRGDLGQDHEAWRNWFADVEWRPESEWLRILADGLAQGNDRVRADRDRWIARNTEILRRSYVEIANPADRSAMLAGLLRDELAPLRRLGVELLKRELANARTVEEPVARAALDLLKDPLADLRQSGAELVFDIRPSGAAAAVSSALLSERDPGVAAAMLRLVGIWPSSTLRPVVIRWLATPGPAQRPAINAAAALLEGELFDPDELRDRVMLSLRQMDIAAVPAAGLRLLCTLGEDEDRAAVASLLQSTNAITRLQAAEALVSHAAYLPEITAAARNDRALFGAASRAHVAHDPTLAGYLRIVALPSPTADARRDGLLAMASRLDARELLPAAQATDDLVIRESVLARLLTSPPDMQLALRGPVGPEPNVVAGLLLLAQTRLELRQPAGALDALDALSPVASAVEAAVLDALRTVALLWLNRIDEAMDLEAPVAAWLDGLERTIGLAHAVDVLETIELRFNGTLTAEELIRFHALRARIVDDPAAATATAAPGGSGNGPVGPPQPPQPQPR